jgi:hypothetical protein
MTETVSGASQAGDKPQVIKGKGLTTVSYTHLTLPTN